jgi:hypothetical protein
MGEEVRKQASSDVSRVVDRYPELFHLGVHGPDLLFYYHALSRNKVNSLGYQLHELSGGNFRRQADEVIKKHPEEDAYLSYLYGFLCHFALDVSCHGYVEQKREESGISHMEIEAELERELLVMDGRDPVREKLTGHLCASPENARIIQEFYPSLTAQEIQKAIQDMIFYLDFLVAPGKIKRGLIYGALKLAGQYDSLKGLVINYEKNPACADSTAKLLTLYEQGRELAVTLVNEYTACLRGEKEPNPIYAYNFETQLTEEGTEK